MNLIEAETKLDDHLMKGIVSEIFWADECKAFAVKIGEHSAATNESQYAHLCSRLQTIMSEHQTLAVAKIYDIDKRTRSIPSVLSLIDDNISVWQLKDRRALELLLVTQGQDKAMIGSATDAELVLLTTKHYRSTLPQPIKASHCDLSASLKAVLESRNKVHAHNEAIHETARTHPTWGGPESLVNYAKDFVCVIAMAFFARWVGKGHGDYYLSSYARRTSQMFEQLLRTAKVIN